MSKFSKGEEVKTLTDGGFLDVGVGDKGIVVDTEKEGAVDVEMSDGQVLFFYDEEIERTPPVPELVAALECLVKELDGMREAMKGAGYWPGPDPQALKIARAALKLAKGVG